MAHGDPITPTNQPNNWSKVKSARVEKYLLLDGADSGAGDDATGAWVKAIGADDVGIVVISSSTSSGATLQIRGYITTDGQDPSASDDGFQISSDVTISSDTHTDLAPLVDGQTFDYIKLIVSSYTDGTYNAPMTVVFR